MKLYTYPPAPSPQRVHILLKEKGIELPFEHIDMLKQEHLSAQYKAINPRGTVPALVLEDGTVISEVIAICHCLEALYPDVPLLGTTPKQKALITEWDHRIEMECLAAVAEALRNRGDAFKNRALPGLLDVEQIPELIPRGIKRIQAFFVILDTQLANNQFITGDEFTMADITAYVAVKFAAWVKQTIPNELEHFKRWFDEVSVRDSISQ